VHGVLAMTPVGKVFIRLVAKATTVPTAHAVYDSTASLRRPAESVDQPGLIKCQHEDKQSSDER
jgi:hypothetical protein